MTSLAPSFAPLRLGTSASFRNMTVFPVLTSQWSVPAYLTLDEAIETGGFHVTEVSETGDVNALMVTNTLERPVLLLDGEEVLGAKQNRVFNLSILVPAASKLAVPVSCVEAGRWRHESAEFKAAPRTQYAAGRGERLEQVSAAMLRSEGPRSDQHEIWANIERKRARLGVRSETGAMADMYGSRAATVDAYVSAFSATEGQVGAAVALNGEMVGLDLFDAPSTLATLLPKLLRSYALDAIEPGLPAGPGPDAQTMLDAVSNSVANEFPAVGLGKDLRLQAPGYRGAALVWEGRTVHLCAFSTGRTNTTRSAGMARSARRGGATSSEE